MWLKVVIVILFLGLVLSLFTGLVYLFKDRTSEDLSSHRTWNALSIRLILAALLIGFLFYGVFTGKLGSKAPWDARYENKVTPVNSKPASTSASPEQNLP